MKNSMIILLGAVLLLSISAVTMLIALNRPVDTLILFLSGTLIPTAVAAYAGHKADTAATAAQKAEHNTNGRMSELIATVREQGKDVPEGYEDVDPEAAPDPNAKPKVDRGVRYHP